MNVDRDAVAARAYALYVRGGRRAGRALDDWLEAERQVRAEAAAAAPPLADEPSRTLVPGAPLPAGKPVVVAPPPSAPAVPAAHVEADRPAKPPKAAGGGRGGKQGKPTPRKKKG